MRSILKVAICHIVLLSTALGTRAQDPMQFKYWMDSTEVVYTVIPGTFDNYFYYREGVFASNPSQKAFEEQITSDGYRHRDYTVYYPNGKCCMWGSYRIGKKKGRWEWFDENGELTAIGHYRKNVKSGYWSYEKTGWYGKMKNGKRHGKWRRFNPEAADGKTVEVVEFKNGVLVSGRPSVPIEEPIELSLISY